MADANKMITRTECNAMAPGTFTGELNRCATKAEIDATGKFIVSGSYANNQLVKHSDMSAKPSKPTIRFSVGELTSSNMCKVVTPRAALNAVIVNIEIITTNGTSSGGAYFQIGDTSVDTSIWPPIYDKNTITSTRITGISYDGKMYQNPPLTTDNAIYTW